jgi:Uma2 family endonuclease
MTLSVELLDLELYPDADGKPMAESDPTRDYLIYGVVALREYFQNRSDAYISGNLFIYYKKGVPDAVVAPDVFAVFGVEKKQRRSYKVWEEGDIVPAFVLEITSKTTQEQDETEKPHKYQNIGVLEYFQYDPTGDYLQPALKGLRLVQGQYQPIAPSFLADGSPSLFSQALELELRLTAGKLRFYDAQGQKLLSPEEKAEALQQAEQTLQQAQQTLQQAQQALQQEAQARREAVPRLLDLGLSVEQIAITLSLSLAEVEQIVRS